MPGDVRRKAYAPTSPSGRHAPGPPRTERRSWPAVRPVQSVSAIATTCASSSRMARARAFRVSLASTVAIKPWPGAENVTYGLSSSTSRCMSRRKVSLGATKGSRWRKAARAGSAERPPGAAHRAAAVAGGRGRQLPVPGLRPQPVDAAVSACSTPCSAPASSSAPCSVARWAITDCACRSWRRLS